MTALIIIAGIILLFIIILNIPVTAHIRFYDGKPDIKVKYGFIRLYPTPPKKSDKKGSTEKPLDDTDTDDRSPPVESDAPENSSDGESLSDDGDIPTDSTATEKEKKPPLGDRINDLLDKMSEAKTAVQLIIELVKNPLIKFLGKIRIDGIVIDFAAANEDAYEAAMLYGRLNTAVYNCLAHIQCHAKTTVKSVTIDCLYNTPKEKSRYDGEAKIRLRPASATNLVFILLCKFLAGYKKYSPILKLIKKQ